MGQRTQATIIAFQKNTGIEPATGIRRDILNKLQQAAFEMIRVIELEKSGIRDGDGLWRGGDVIGGMGSDIKGLVTRLCATYDRGGNPVGDFETIDLSSVFEPQL
jgi:hypothetical protein